jgi:hypothetical protein
MDKMSTPTLSQTADCRVCMLSIAGVYAPLLLILTVAALTL